MKKMIRLLAFVILVVALDQLAGAQQGKIYRVGVLGPPGKVEDLSAIRGLRDGLKEAGYLEGQNLQINFPNVQTYDQLRPIAKGYVEKKVDVIITHGGTAASIAKEATTEIPIIFIWGLREPVALGFVKSLAHPGGNITGLNSEPGSGIYGKRLELFKEVVPRLRRVTLFYNARGENPGHVMNLSLARETAPKLSLTLDEKPAKSISDVSEALRTLSKETSDGINFICSGLFEESFKQIVSIAVQKKLPISGCSAEHTVRDGALFSYDPNRYQNGYRGAWYVDRVLKGTKPADLPIEQPKKFEFVINLKTAKQIGLTIPPRAGAGGQGIK